MASYEADRDANQLSYNIYSNMDFYRNYSSKYAEIVKSRKLEFETLSDEIREYFEKNKQTITEFRQKMTFCRDLKEAIHRNCPEWVFDICPYGSSINGLALKNADLDIAIHIPQLMKCFENQNKSEFKICERKASLNVLQIIRRILQNDEQIKMRIQNDKDIEYVPAQIQILKIRTKDGLECEISVVIQNFLSSLHNSFLLRHFVNLEYDRFAPLCAIVKKWATLTKVRNPKTGGFNSYALVLLLIHFLQCGTVPPILPHFAKCYKDDNFFAMNDKKYPLRLDFGQELPRPLPNIEKNKQCVAEIFFQFLKYYEQFDFQHFYPSLRDGRAKDRKKSLDERVQKERAKEVYIEDPFDDHNPGRTVRTIGYIKHVLRKTIQLFEANWRENREFPKLDDIFDLTSESEKAKIDDNDDSNTEKQFEIESEEEFC